MKMYHAPNLHEFRTIKNHQRYILTDTNLKNLNETYTYKASYETLVN